MGGGIPIFENPSIPWVGYLPSRSLTRRTLCLVIRVSACRISIWLIFITIWLKFGYKRVFWTSYTVFFKWWVMYWDRNYEKKNYERSWKSQWGLRVPMNIYCKINATFSRTGRLTVLISLILYRRESSLEINSRMGFYRTHWIEDSSSSIFNR